MSYSNQILHSISIAKLKGLVDLDELSLDCTPLTAITGTNGSGKSTILHALACVYAPLVGRPRQDYKFPHFFLPTTGSTWRGSSFSVRHSYRFGSNPANGVRAVYAKTNDRWTPRYERRPQREVRYIGVDTCVPSIERERSTTFLELTSAPWAAEWAPVTLDAASKILNRSYSSLSIYAGRNRVFRGLRHDGVEYSSLSMGAGEQRVLEIVERVFSAPRNSLILIDEIDLLLHEDALRRLITVVNERAAEKALQVIFTTHRESILARSDLTVHHVFGANGKTFTMPSAHPDVWQRLTGDSRRTLEVFVEDDLAQAVVNKICFDLGVRRHVETVIVGAASNLFTLAGGLALRGESLGRKLVILDGDVYRAENERNTAINRVITGHGEPVNAVRRGVFEAIKMFSLPHGMWPEKFIHSLLVSGAAGMNPELQDMARTIGMPLERHGFLNCLIERVGERREVAIARIVDEAAKACGWASYVEPVRASIVEKLAPIFPLNIRPASVDAEVGAGSCKRPGHDSTPAPLI